MSEFEEWRKMLVDVADTLAEASQFLDEDNALALVERIHSGLSRIDEHLVPGLTAQCETYGLRCIYPLRPCCRLYSEY